jgi:hypothetical protein
MSVSELNAMTALELKNNMHAMIDICDDKELLIEYIKMWQRINDKIGFNLSKEEEEELLGIEKESHDPKNQIPHEEVLKKLKRWF